MKPAYRDRYPCTSCGCGYLDCASYALAGLKCCVDCDNHPERWTTSPAYTEAELDDMWARSGRPRPRWPPSSVSLCTPGADK